MDIKKIGGGTVDAKEVMEYRVSTLVATGKPVGWHRHGSEEDDQPAVYQKLGINFKEGQAARAPDGEWQSVAEEFAEEFAKKTNEDAEGVVISAEEILKHLETSDSRPGSKSGMKKADYEEIGRDVSGFFEDLSAEGAEKDSEEDHHTTKEWVDEQWTALKETLLGLDAENKFEVSIRPVKVKPAVSAAAKERERAIAEMREQGVSEDIINKVYPSE